MSPLIRVVLAAAGAFVAARLTADGMPFFAVVIGALAGLALSEMIQLRDGLTKLQRELQDLRREHRPPPAAAAAPVMPTKLPAQPPLPPSPIPPPAAAPQLTVARGTAAREAAPSAARRTFAGVPPAASPNPLFALLRDYFTGGNTLVRAGIVVLFFGVAFLLRYLAEHTHLPIELRLSAVACGAVVLLVLGWRLRSKRPGYALALQGGAVGILYLTVFSALHLYSLLTPTAAFFLLAAIAALGTALAVLQDSLAVALLAVTGGFLAPFLASTGSGNHVALFSYFLVLNAVILAIAWFRAWRPLNLAGFVFTFVLSTLWGVLQYRPQDFASTEPFLVVFFLIYVGIAILYGNRQTPEGATYLDGAIVFGTPLAVFGLQAALLLHQPLLLAYSALVTSALYLSLGWLLWRGARQRLLVEAFLSLGVAFVTLAIPLALNGRWSAATWALEGAALIWVGCRQQRRLPRALGTLLQLAAGATLALGIQSSIAVPPGTYVAALMIGVASVGAAVFLATDSEQLADYEQGFSAVLFCWGLAWWCIGGVSELWQHVDRTQALAVALAFASGTALLSSFIARRTRLRIALWPAAAWSLFLLFFALWSVLTEPHPLAHGGSIAWPIAVGCCYWILRRHDSALAAAISAPLHALTLWLWVGLLSWESAWQVSHALGGRGAWSSISWALAPLAVLSLLPKLHARLTWPVQVHERAYLRLASGGLALFLVLWSLASNFGLADPAAPLPYLPLLNPLDIVQALVLIALTRFWLRLREAEKLTADLDLRPLGFGLALLVFLWLTAVLLRSLHHWLGIPYVLKVMLDSTLVESALSIFWASLALATMLVATRLHARSVWLSGAALLVLVVAKLFLVDLASIGTVERIVSFVGVGLLMLVLGYFSPLPPAVEEPVR